MATMPAPYDPDGSDISSILYMLAALLESRQDAELSQMPRYRLVSPVRWLGGKHRLAASLAAMLPPHRLYAEVFGGAAHVLFAKPPSQIEIYNDVDEGLITFWRVLRDPLQSLRLEYNLSRTPYSRRVYEHNRTTWRGVADPVERALRWFVIARMSFGGNFGGSWGYGRTINPARAWTNVRATIRKARTRLQQVVVEHGDWFDVIQRYDDPQTLYYLDPPYTHAQRRAGRYRHELSDSDHERLVDLLLAIQGSAIISGYANPIYTRLEQAGWPRYERHTTCSAAGRTRRSGLAQPGAVLAHQKRIECLWVSPRCAGYVAERAEAVGWQLAVE